MAWYNRLPTMGSKPKKKEREDPFRKNAHKRTDYACINCPNCDYVITYKESKETNNIVCPSCKHFFVPAFSRKPRVVPFWVEQSPSDWLEI